MKVLYFGCPAEERHDVERRLDAGGLTVVWADNAASVSGELQRRKTPILVDLSRGAAALQSARDIRAEAAAALMFAVVDAGRPDLTIEAVLAGMADVFDRPLSGRRVARAIERERLYESGDADGTLPAETDDDLYAHSDAMRQIAAAIARAATLRGAVMIRGEEGTGRRVAARAIHALQGGNPAAFVSVNCAEAGLDLDAVLFGNSGKATRTEGLERVSRGSLLYEARNGTLYLQNLAEAPSRVQARLARLLRDREAVIAETGDSTDFEVRPITGVDAAFDGAVADGRVRDDLFKRLSAIRIDMPPLRSRREDIPVLANRFLREICATEHVPPKTLSRPALALISALPWRGNAVELRTLLQNIVTGLQGGRNIGLEEVLAHVQLDGGSVVSPMSGTLKQARARFEREYITAVLEQHHGRISEAARALGIQRTNLYRKMRTLRIKSQRR